MTEHSTHRHHFGVAVTINSLYYPDQILSMTKLPNSPIMSFYTSSSSTAGDPPSDSFLQPLELSPTRVITSRKTRSKEAVLRLLLTQSTVLWSFDIDQKDLIPVDR